MTTLFSKTIDFDQQGGLGGPRWAFGGPVISSLEENDAGAQKWSQRHGTKLNHLIYGYSWSFGGVWGQFGPFGAI